MEEIFFYLFKETDLGVSGVLLFSVFMLVGAIVDIQRRNARYMNIVRDDERKSDEMQSKMWTGVLETFGRLGANLDANTRRLEGLTDNVGANRLVLEQNLGLLRNQHATLSAIPSAFQTALDAGVAKITDKQDVTKDEILKSIAGVRQEVGGITSTLDKIQASVEKMPASTFIHPSDSQESGAENAVNTKGEYSPVGAGESSNG